MTTTAANLGDTLRPWGLILCLVAWPIVRPAFAQPADAHAQVRFFKDSPLPQAVVLSVNGQATFAEDGKQFKKLKAGDVLNQGAVVRTDPNARVDLFFRRMAIAVRLTSDTELGLEKMTRARKGDVFVMETILDLRKGDIFCFVRGLVADSKFEVRHKTGRSVVEGEGPGGFEIRDDSAVVSGRSYFVPLKVISETGTAVIAPGQKFDAKHGKVMRLAPSEEELTLIQLDELHALTDLLTPEEELATKK
ncbi:MAG: FecR family protein [Limisphaerales bacterium]